MTSARTKKHLGSEAGTEDGEGVPGVSSFLHHLSTGCLSGTSRAYGQEASAPSTPGLCSGLHREAQIPKETSPGRYPPATLNLLHQLTSGKILHISCSQISFP